MKKNNQEKTQQLDENIDSGIKLKDDQLKNVVGGLAITSQQLEEKLTFKLEPKKSHTGDGKAGPGLEEEKKKGNFIIY